MRLLITRHSITKYNEEGIIQGKQHGSITRLGYKQIEKLIKRLKKENITRIISSDALRCKITTQEITKQINVPFEYTSLIDEKSYGNFTGKKASEVNWETLKGDLVTKYPQDGENLIMVKKRAEKFFKQFIEKYKDTQETILIVSHGIFLQILIGNLLGMNIKDSRYKLLIDHCSLSNIDINKKYESGYRLIYLNEKDFSRKQLIL